MLADVANDCKHYHARTKGCAIHVRCKQGDLVQLGQAASVKECADYADHPAPVVTAVKPLSSCIHFMNEIVGETVACGTCPKRTQLKVFGCRRLGKCTPVTAAADESVGCCNGRRDATGIHRPCEHYSTEQPKPLEPVQVIGDPAVQRAAPKPLLWSYGITTVPERRDTYLPATVAALRGAGFDRPRLFVDGDRWSSEWERFGLDMTFRTPRVRSWGNWVLALWELYLRQPDADRFAVFQDDMEAVRNLRQYLDGCAWPGKAFLNLYQYGTFNGVGQGWYESPALPSGRTYHGKDQQRGLGAVALVFDREAVVELLMHRHVVERCQDLRPIRNKPGWTMGSQKIDGGIVESMNQAGYREYVHWPPLVQHAGDNSSMGNNRHPKAPQFDPRLDALTLLS